MEGLSGLKVLLEPNDFMITIDLSDACMTLPIEEESRNYLCFQFQDQMFRFCVLPFGPNNAPRAFTKTLKPPVGTLRSLGFKIVVYLHDIILAASTRELCIYQGQILIKTLENLGFVINPRSTSSSQIYPKSVDKHSKISAHHTPELRCENMSKQSVKKRFDLDFQTNSKCLQNATSRHACIHPKLPSSKVFLLDSGSTSCWNGCILSKLEQIINYLFPPFSLIQKCLRKIIEDKATVLLITPVWQSRPWYPIILTESPI